MQVDRVTVARFIYSLDAFLGILAVAGACLYGAAYNPHASVWTIVLTTFVPFSALWAAFCYGAYKGLASDNAFLKFMFWFHVGCNVFAFPIGTAIAGVAIWLWRTKRAVVRPASGVAGLS